MLLNNAMRITHLDGLRGLLALLVVISHLSGSITGYSQERYFTNVNIAVDTFFVLSGFVLSRLYLMNSSYGFKKILISRFLRLFPLYILTTLAVFFIYKLNNITGGYFPGTTVIEFNTLLVNLTMFNDMGFNSIPVLNDPAWSVIVEFWVSGFLMFFFIRSKLYIILAISLLAYLVVFLAGHGFGVKDELFLEISLNILRGIAGISFGVALYKINKNLESMKKYEFSEIVLILSFVYFFIFLTLDTKNLADTSIFIFFILFFLMNNTNNIIVKILNHPYSQYIGKLSFSIYLIHTPIILLVSPYLVYKQTNSQTITILLFIIIIIIISDFVNKFFERPLHDLFKNYLSKNYL